MRSGFCIFSARIPCCTCVSSYQRCSNSCAATPTLTPNPSPAPPGEKGEPTALCGRMLEVDEFTVNRQPSKRPLTAVCGRVLEVVEFTVNRQPSKWTKAAPVASHTHAVPGKFECWPLHVNATPHKALAE